MNRNFSQRLALSTDSSQSSIQATRSEPYQWTDPQQKHAAKIILLQLLKRVWRKRCLEVRNLDLAANGLENEKNDLKRILSKYKMNLQDEEDRCALFVKNCTTLNKQCRDAQDLFKRTLESKQALELENQRLKSLLKSKEAENTRLKVNLDLNLADFELQICELRHEYATLNEKVSFDNFGKNAKKTVKSIYSLNSY